MGLRETREPIQPDVELAGRLFAELAVCTGGREGICRRSYGEGEQLAHDILRREGERLGLEAETDAACNLYLTLPGVGANGRIIFGSHLDSVPRGGNFDGAAGVLCGLAVLSGMAKAGSRPVPDITVMAIRAEESTWFEASYIGSRAAFGRLDARELDELRRTNDRMRLADAVAACGGDVGRLRSGVPHIDPAEVLLFLEVHIEQGPGLVMADAPVGVVSGIRGSFRHRSASCIGEYGHSGATPRLARRDAVLATSALVMAMEEVWDSAELNGDDLAVTFGQVTTDPAEHAFSKVPGRVDFALDVRSQSAATLDKAEGRLAELAERMSERYSVRFDLGPRTGSEPALMDDRVIAGLREACIAEGVQDLVVPSGGGHDAAVFASEGIPTGMLFIRNRHGSHNPRESMEMADFEVAARVASRLCASFAA